MIRLVVALLFWGLPGLAFAQTRPVLSGEHGTFTRLSVPIPDGAMWELRDDGQDYALSVEDEFDYDLAGVFDRIGRGRISGVVQTEGDLRIELACACSASTFVFLDRYVVIDISDEPKDRRLADRAGSLPPDAPLAVPDLALPLVNGIDGPTVVRTDPSASTNGRGPLPDQADLRDVQRQLSEALRTAAAADLLVNQDTAELVETPVDPRPNPHPGSPVPFGTRPDLPGLTFRNASAPRLEAAPDASVCWPRDYTDASAWVADDTRMTAELSERRSILTDTLGTPDPTAVDDLARAYLYFGFGAEAAQTLDLDDSDSRARQALRAMAEVVDDRGSGSALTSQAGCPGPIELWVYLIGSRDTPPSADIVLTFKQLPTGLQLAIGGRLALRLAEDGRREDADQVLQTLIDKDAPRHDQTLNAALVSLAADPSPMTQVRIDSVLASDGPLPPEMLVALADRVIAADLDPPEDLIARLEDRVFTERGTLGVGALRAALTRSYSAAGRHLDAFAQAQPTEDPVPDQLVDLRSSVVLAAARDADVATVVEIAFHPQSRTVDAKAQNALARRLLDLGFPDEARQLLDGPAQGGTMGERRYLRAEAEMAAGEPALAAETLSGITTPRAAAILAQTDWATLQQEPDARASLAWRQSDWSQLVESDDEDLQNLATLATGPAPEPVLDALLTSGREIADEAAAARATLEMGLARFTAPTD